MKLRFYITIGIFFILAGTLLSSQSFLHFFQTKNSQPFLNNTQIVEINKSHSNEKKATISGQPVSISIPSVNINIPVDPGVYNPKNQTWTLSLTNAEYATITPLPNNQEGNTFIYGHNRWQVFYRLLKANIGDEAIIKTSNNHTFIYKMVAEKVTQPNDLSLFKYNGPPILTLQTCSGLIYQNRQFFIFNLVSVA